MRDDLDYAAIEEALERVMRRGAMATIGHCDADALKAQAGRATTRLRAHVVPLYLTRLISRSRKALRAIERGIEQESQTQVDAAIAKQMEVRR